jgi:hypothetical protein
MTEFSPASYVPFPHLFVPISSGWFFMGLNGITWVYMGDYWYFMGESRRFIGVRFWAKENGQMELTIWPLSILLDN